VIATVLAAAAAAAPVAADAHRIAAQISSWGPRPATSEREARAHRLIQRVFRRAELRVGVQEFRSPDHLGALALAHRARAHGARRRLRFALSLDEVGRDRPFWLRSPVEAPRARVEGALLAAAGRVGTPVSWVRDESTGNSDHREFELLGLPGAKLGVGAGGEPCRHMACDRPSRLDPKSLLLVRKMTTEAVRAR